MTDPERCRFDSLNKTNQPFWMVDTIDLRHTATILVMFPVSSKSNECQYSLYKKEPDYFSFQPWFGYIEMNGRKIKMAAP